MNRTELENALRVWRKAYEIFISPNFPQREFAKQPENGFAEAWLRENASRLSAELRPGETELRPVVNMLCSFPATSMNEKAAAIRNKGRGFSDKTRRNNDMLKRLALEQLAQERGAEIAPDAFERLTADVERHLDLIVVTYARELVRRTEFASQGMAVYMLWMLLPEDRRTDITYGLAER